LVRTLAGILMLLATAAASASAPIATPAAQSTPSAAVLHARVVNLRNSTGQVICTLFNSPMAFPTDSTRASNWFGLPKEGYAFSNNVRPVFSPPSFKAAAFDYSVGDLWLTMVMRY
jgi:uncharacterized protein (DUF2141 family)